MTATPASTRLRALVVLLAALAAAALTARLGIWQLDRAAQKVALQRSLDERVLQPELAPSALATTEDEAQAQHYRRIRLRGAWLQRYTVFLDNRQMAGRPGFFVVTPLKLAGSAVIVVVQRGWAARDPADRARLPPVPTPGGEVEVAGHVAPPPAHLFEFAPPARETIRQNLDMASYAREIGAPLAPLSVVQDGTGAGDGLRREWPRPAFDVQKHYGYAFQWFSLCALIAGLYVWFQLIQPRRRRT